MIPTDFARNLARSDKFDDHVLGVAMIARGLSDDDPVTLRAGWPLDRVTVEAAAEYLGLVPTPELVSEALRIAPAVSDAMLNKAPRR